MLEYSQPLEPRVERALAHPTRRAILELLAGAKELSPGAIAEKLAISTANVAYHVEVLTICGAVEASANKRHGERLFRLPAPAPKVGPNERDGSGSMRPDATDAQLRSLIEMVSHLRPGQQPSA